MALSKEGFKDIPLLWNLNDFLCASRRLILRSLLTWESSSSDTADTSSGTVKVGESTLVLFENIQERLRLRSKGN
jgi:hypothetical protein